MASNKIALKREQASNKKLQREKNKKQFQQRLLILLLITFFLGFLIGFFAGKNQKSEITFVMPEVSESEVLSETTAEKQIPENLP